MCFAWNIEQIQIETDPELQDRSCRLLLQLACRARTGTFRFLLSIYSNLLHLSVKNKLLKNSFCKFFLLRFGPAQKPPHVPSHSSGVDSDLICWKACRTCVKRTSFDQVAAEWLQLGIDFLPWVMKKYSEGFELEGSCLILFTFVALILVTFITSTGSSWLLEGSKIRTIC